MLSEVSFLLWFIKLVDNDIDTHKTNLDIWTLRKCFSSLSQLLWRRYYCERQWKNIIVAYCLRCSLEVVFMICAATVMWHIVFVVETELTLSLIYDIHLLSAFGSSSSSHLLVTTGSVVNLRRTVVWYSQYIFCLTYPHLASECHVCENYWSY